MSENNARDEIYYLSDPILIHMGLVISFWGALEHQMEFLILHNQEISVGRGLLLTTNLSYRSKSDILRTFANEDDDLPKEERDILKSVVNRANQLYGIRNMIAHAQWMPTDDPQKARVMSVRTTGKLRLLDKDVDVEELKCCAKELRDLGAELIDFIIRNKLQPDSNS